MTGTPPVARASRRNDRRRRDTNRPRDMSDYSPQSFRESMIADLMATGVPRKAAEELIDRGAREGRAMRERREHRDEQQAAEAVLLDAMAGYMRAGGDGDELIEMAQGEAEWWREERAARDARKEDT